MYRSLPSLFSAYRELLLSSRMLIYLCNEPRISASSCRGDLIREGGHFMSAMRAYFEDCKRRKTAGKQVASTRRAGDEDREIYLSESHGSILFIERVGGLFCRQSSFRLQMIIYYNPVRNMQMLVLSSSIPHKSELHAHLAHSAFTININTYTSATRETINWSDNPKAVRVPNK